MLFNLAKRNLTRNFKNYLLYFFSSAFCVIIFYTFLALSFDDTIKKAASESLLVNYSLKGAAIGLILFTIIFITYSSNFFAHKRKKELGTYVLLGLRKRQIGQMMFYENFAMGILALIAGIFGGILLYTSFVSLLLQFIDVQVEAKLTISMEAMFATVLVFLLLTIVTSFEGYRIVYRFTVLNLLKATSAIEKQARGGKVAATIGVLLLFIGYAIALTPANSGLFYKDLPTAMQLIIVILTMIAGTFLFVGSFLPAVLAKLATIKPFYFNGVNMISVANLRFRMRTQAKMMATISILIAITLSAIGFTGSLYNNIRAQSENFISTDYQISNGNEAAATKFIEIAGATNISYQNNVTLLTEKSTFISESKYRELMKQIFDQNVPQLKKNEAIALTRENQLTHKEIKELQSTKQPLTTRHAFQVRSVKITNPVNSSADILYVLNDADFNALSKTATKETSYLYNLTDDNISTAEKIVSQNGKFGEAFFMSYLNFHHQNAVSTGSILFIGLFIGLTFLVATGCIIYFKQITEAYNDRHQYTLMRKIGMDHAMIHKTIAHQILVIFLIPFLLGICHTIVALTAFGQNTDMSVTFALSTVILAYAIIYAIYYFFTVRNYMQIAKSE
ncbi:ABC transporter permease [Listeria grandensis]|uniref:ABC transporter permease n=1 Tax=Listeria grandensis TaxID=1494963 RepID=UPI001624561F|nr:ABC transporter permease [Listeria grandensis]MBC1473771.1 ABC transporter permease [Listeria grandensis]